MAEQVQCKNAYPARKKVYVNLTLEPKEWQYTPAQTVRTAIVGARSDV